MRKELKRTPVGKYSFREWEGEAVVKNFARISACLQNWKYLTCSCCCFLAKPVFTGKGNDGEIIWETEAFDSVPVLLKSLQRDEGDKYRRLLDEHLCAVREAMEKEHDISRRSMFESAFSYISEDKVFCADGKLVVAEWGMFPKGIQPVDMMSKYMSQVKTRQEPLSVKQDGIRQTDGTEEKAADDVTEMETKSKLPEKAEAESPELFSGSESIFSEEHRMTEDERRVKEKHAGERQAGGEKVAGNDKETVSDKGGTVPGERKLSRLEKKSGWDWKSFLRRWWWLLLLILLIFWDGIFLSRCSGDGGGPLQDIPTVMPPVGHEDIVASPDSLTQEVSDRLNVIIRKGGGVADFVKAFRQVYPDVRRYELIYYDTLIPRVQIRMSREEKQRMKEELRDKFPGFELSVLPESIFKHQYISDDPALKDPQKRWYFDLCRVFRAWDISRGNPEVVVAVVDDGFDLNHPELKGKYVKPYNAVTHTSQVTPSEGGHGTHVASTAVGIAGNAAGTAGIAPLCRLMPVQVANERGIMSTTAVIDGVLYAITQGADVINLSLGMQFGPLLQYMPIGFQRDLIAYNFLEEEQLWNEIFAMADERHCTLVLAAGNENVLAGIEPMQRNASGVKVSAIQPDLVKAGFSNYGDFSTLSAPGVAIYNAIPGGRYTCMDGTSMAAPIVTGAVALLKSVNPQLSTPEVIRILQQTGLYSLSPVGKVLQLDRALAAVADGEEDDVGGPVPLPGGGEDCTAVRRKIRRLMEEIEQLKKEHPGCWQIPDTLRLPEKPDLSQLQGCWQSTGTLHTSGDKEVVLYFDFFGNSRGKIWIAEDKYTVFTATTTLTVDGNKLIISQDTEARSGNNAGSYNPYYFVCRPGKGGVADCAGVNKRLAANKVNFKLIKINE